jgi:hypothetical protein
MSICAYTEGPSSVIVTADSKGFLKIWDQANPETGTRNPLETRIPKPRTLEGSVKFWVRVYPKTRNRNPKTKN